MKVIRVLDIPVYERRRPAGKSAGDCPGRRIGPFFGKAKLLEALPGKSPKLQFNGDRTANRHRWAS